MSNQFSITRALNELKLLDSRISRATNEAKFVVANKVSNKKIDGIKTVDEFITDTKASYQSVIDLINRRKEIKSKIVQSNAITQVVIDGITYTVAEAIERKGSIIYEENLLRTMVNQYNNVVATVNRNNELMYGKIDSLLDTTFGKEGKTKVNEDEINSITSAYKLQNETVVINPLDLEKKIKELANSIENFKSEVDYVLSTSNAITMIEVN